MPKKREKLQKIMEEKFSLKWDHFHSNASKSFSVLRNADYLHDVTLVSDDHKQMSAHKLVLSACSEYFKDIFKNNDKNLHPLLCLEGTTSRDLQNILDYVYNGEAQVYQDNLDRFLEMAQRFKLQGLLTENRGEDNGLVGKFENDVTANNSFNEPMGLSTQGMPKKATIKNENTADSMDVGMPEKVIIPVSSMEMSELDTKVNQHWAKCDDGSYSCTLCGKNMARKDHIRKHIEIHLDGISIPCNVCEKTFRSKNSLQKHKYVYHKQ